MPQAHPLFSFALIADSHLNPQDALNTSPWRTNRLANERNRFVIRELNRLKPAFVVHLGDIVHPVPVNPAYGPAAEFAKRLFGDLTCPLYLVPGNHDVGDKPLDWMPADCITESAIRRYREVFGDDWGIFEHQDCRFVWINSSLINSNLPAEGKQKRWLEATLAEASGHRVFLFTHYPPYVSSAGESSHYDNIDEPGRSWLLDLIERYRVEAVFAGHVHNFFFNQHGAAGCYVLPSVTNLRQDYSELFRVEPADEYGRNDVAKLGFFMIDIHRDRHVARFVRTGGATVADCRDGLSGFALVPPVPSPIGVHLRHAWAEEIELPYNAPLDELSRKRVRNDYGLLAMLDLGITQLRVPLSDLRDERIRSRMVDLLNHGLRFTVFSFGPPDPAIIGLMKTYRRCIDRWEIVLLPRTIESALDSLRPSRGDLPDIWLSRLRGHEAGVGHDGTVPFDHTTSLGFDAAEAGDLRALWKRTSAGEVFAGVLFRIELEQPISSEIGKITELSEELRLRAMLCVKFAPTKSAAVPQDDHTVANRVAEAVLCAYANPRIEMFLDTFQDIDRGYFLRPGLIDRRCNPRLAGWVFRNFQLMLRPLGPLGSLCETQSESGRKISFHAREAEGVLWLPHSAQLRDKKLGAFVPISSFDPSDVPVRGPWVEVHRRCR